MLKNILKSSLHPFEKELFVLGLSGGADSVALFLLLRELNIRFVVAHVDHGWREESRDEAQKLQKIVEAEGVSFYLRACKKEDFTGNLEEAARDIRLKFFNEVIDLNQAFGVILGHHADDLTENTLKRLFEGSSLYALFSMQKVSNYGNLKIFRPFLNVPKKQIIKYLENIAHPYFEDKTNLSSQFLRGRMRSQIIPFLSQEFGKQVVKPLINLSEESQELKKHLEICCEGYEKVIGPFGFYFDLTKTSDVYLLKYLMHKTFKEEGIKVIGNEIDYLAHAISERTANFTRFIGNKEIVVDRGYVFFLNGEVPSLNNWTLLHTSDEPLTDWKSIWKGRGVGYIIEPGQLSFDSHIFDKWWNRHKIPAFFRKFVPVSLDSEQPFYEFLSGKVKFPNPKGIKVVIQHCTPK